jgi:hypothetical protein
MLKKFIRRAKPRWNEIGGIDPFLAFREHDLDDFAVQTDGYAQPAIRCPDSGTRPYSRISHGMPTEPFPHEQHFEEPWGNGSYFL